MSEHEQDWESRYESGDTPWDRGAPAPPLLDWLFRNSISGAVLVPGCGAGHDVRALARAGCAPIGVDCAPSAIRRAESFPKAGQETYRLADLFSLPPDLTGAFDWAFEHTCFCAIPPNRRPEYAAAIHSALRSGGHLLAIFYLDPKNGPGESGPPFGVSQAELHAIFDPGFEWISASVPAVAFPGREGCELIALLRRR